MGRARIRAILAALRSALAGLLLLLALQLADAMTPPAAAAGAGGGAVTPVAGRPDAPTSPRFGPTVASDAGLPPGSAAVMRVHRPTGQPNPAAADTSAARSAPGGPLLFAANAPTIPVQRATAPASGLPPPAAAGEAMLSDQERQSAASPLERRLQQWPAWRLPAPLPRPGRQAPLWPGWFSGEWQVESTPLPAGGSAPGPPGAPWRARFRADGHGGAVAERAFNALSVGRSQLGEQLLSVQDDPRNPQRQLARLAGDRLLETSLIGQRGEQAGAQEFLNDELSLLVLHGPGEPRLSRIETLGRWRLQTDGSIAGEQWQARYASPGDGLAATPLASDHWSLRLVPVPPGSDRATGTAAPAAGYR